MITAQRVSVFGVFLVRIFPHLNRIRRDCYINTFLPNAPISFKAFPYFVKNSQKFCKIHRKTTWLGSVFNKVASLKACNFIKKRLQKRRFPMNICEIFKNTYFGDHLQMAAFDMKRVKYSLLKIPRFRLISWCGNFLEMYTYEETRQNYGILCSDILCTIHMTNALFALKLKLKLKHFLIASTGKNTVDTRIKDTLMGIRYRRVRLFGFKYIYCYRNLLRVAKDLCRSCSSLDLSYFVVHIK